MFIVVLFIPPVRDGLIDKTDTVPEAMEWAGSVLVSTALMAVYGAIAGAIIMGIAGMLRASKSEHTRSDELLSRLIDELNECCELIVDAGRSIRMICILRAGFHAEQGLE
jgi:hypothetical protein